MVVVMMRQLLVVTRPNIAFDNGSHLDRRRSRRGNFACSVVPGRDDGPHFADASRQTNYPSHQVVLVENFWRIAFAGVRVVPHPPPPRHHCRVGGGARLGL